MAELKIRLKSPMVAIRNGMIAETHRIFPRGIKPEETNDYGYKAIANTINCTLMPTSILGWLRAGVTEYLIEQGISVCHGYDLNLPTKDYRNFVIQDLEHGYHRKVMTKGEHAGKPECEAVIGNKPESQRKKCIVAEMFGSFAGKHRVFSILPVKTSPVDSHYTKGIKNITGKGNFMTVAVSPRSAVDGTPYATHDMNVVANLDAVLYIKMYEPNPRMDVHIAMLLRAFEYLNKKSNDFKHQLGGNRTFGCGFIEPTILPIGMERDDIVAYHSKLIKMEEKAEDAEGITESMKKTINDWEEQKKKYDTILDAELKIQKELFGIDKKWWQTS